MNDKNGYFILSTTRVLLVRASYSSALTGNTILTQMFDELETQQTNIVDYSLKLNISTKTYTTAGNAIRDKAAMDFSIAAMIMSAYGVKHNKPELEGMGRFTHSELLHCSLAKQVTDCNKIKAVIDENTLNLAEIGIDAAFLSVLTNDLLQLQSDTLLPQNMIDQHKNDNILFEEQIVETRTLLDKQIDKAMQLYRVKNIPFYLAYTAARKVRHHHLKRKLPVIDSETTTGVLELLVLDKDTLKPLAGVQLMVLLLNLVTTTDEDGELYEDLIVPGTYQGKLTYDGYKDVDFTLTIEAGKSCTLQLLMEKSIEV